MSSLRSTSLGIMRPPKPPCWRDFVVPTPKSITSEGIDLPDPTGRTLGARSPTADLLDVSRSSASLPGNKPSRLVRRPRARIHRTRSEHVIHAEDLPESAFTGTLADTDPKGLRTRMPDGRLYVEENNRRCQTWLASIEAAEPLDEVDYTKEQRRLSASLSDISGSLSLLKADHRDQGDAANRRKLSNYELIPISELEQGTEEQGIDGEQGVEVEVPEETFVWDVSQDTRPQSPSSGEEMCSSCKKISPQVDNKQHAWHTCTHVDNVRTVGHSAGLSKDKQKFSTCPGESCSVDNSRTVKSGKESSNKKLHTRICDHREDDSSRLRETKCSNSLVGFDDVDTGSVIKAHGHPSTAQSDSRSCSRGKRSSSKRSSSRNVLTEGDISDLEGSTLPH